MTSLKRTLFLVFSLILSSGFSLKAQHIELLQQGTPASIRGLSVVDDNVAWISGSKGYIAITTDGGKTWNWQQLKGFKKSDFRDIEAFSAKKAVIMSSGTPALILSTEDGGINWKTNYKQTDSTYFLDAMDFDSPQHGFVMGDPIKGKFLLMETNDGGISWKNINGPYAFPNQAAFAASGTCLITNNLLAITTGGSKAELIISSAKNNNWAHHALPIIQGKSAQGSFSVATEKNRLVIVGGDYQQDKQQDSTACYSTDRGTTWHLSDRFPAGYQSCVAFISGDIFLSTGTSGTNITTDGGKTWTKLDDLSYNVCAKAKHGKMVLLAGDKGKIGVFKF